MSKMRTKTVTCLSGLQGEQRKLRPTYGTFSSFRHYAEMYNIHGRLGFATPREAWDAAPTIQSSTNPSDLCRVDSDGTRHQESEASWGVGNLSKR